MSSGKHPIKEKSTLISEAQRKEINYTNHFKEDVVATRTNISEDLVTKYLRKNFNNLITFKYKKDRYESYRYNLIFDKSSQYYLLIAISFVNSHINIITAFVTRKHRGNPEKLVSRWG